MTAASATLSLFASLRLTDDFFLKCSVLSPFVPPHFPCLLSLPSLHWTPYIPFFFIFQSLSVPLPIRSAYPTHTYCTYSTYGPVHSSKKAFSLHGLDSFLSLIFLIFHCAPLSSVTLLHSQVSWIQTGSSRPGTE